LPRFHLAAAAAALMHSLTGACLAAAGPAAGPAAIGVLVVVFWLPARPRAEPAGTQRERDRIP
jgi:hypothetical protein